MKILFLLIASIVVLPSVWSGEVKVLFLGDSLTAGYGVPKEKAYPYLVQKKLEDKLKKKIKIYNGSVSGSTTASGVSRLKFFKRVKPEYLFLGLGANDGLRGLPVQKTKENLMSIVEAARKEKMTVILAGMLLPKNYGEKYRQGFEAVFKEVKEKYQLKTIPFLLEGVATKRELNQEDGIHPNEAGHVVIAEKVFPVLFEVMNAH